MPQSFACSCRSLLREPPWPRKHTNWGLFNNRPAGFWLTLACCVVALDFAVCAQHVLFYAVPFLWRIHQVHHADRDFDVTTGVRFHTVEIVLSLVNKSAVVVILGTPAFAILCFEILLNVTAMFNHSNIRIPPPLDRLLRLIVVTPDMHRVHHSAEESEANRNFGFNVPWWDFLFSTYLALPANEHKTMRIGIPSPDSAGGETLARLLTLPFRTPGRNAGVSCEKTQADEQSGSRGNT